MVDWQITATTIYCDAVNDEVTIMVYKDWSVKCTAFNKYTDSHEGSLQPVNKSTDKRRTIECQGINCERVTGYVNNLKAEEAAK